MQREDDIPSGLRQSRGLQRIWDLARRKNEPGRQLRYRLYVIEVSGSPDFVYYVGSTSRKVETRFRQHASGNKEDKAAKLFWKFGATAKELRYDLFEGLPYFSDRETAEQAEGILADVVETQLKAAVNCDVLRSRKREREVAKAERKSVKKAAAKPTMRTPGGR